MSRSRSQTLITGVYRTGTEYVAQITGSHPEVSVTMYMVNALRFVYGRFNPIEDHHQYRAAVASIAERLFTRYKRDLPVNEVIARLDSAACVTYGILYDEVMSALYLRPPAEHWAEKNQLLWREIPLFLESMPNGRVLLVLRDPRSVLVSFKKYTYAPPPAYLGAVFNCYDAMLHTVRYRERIPRNRLCVVRYEDAAREPQAEAERIWSFLGLSGRYDVSDRGRWQDAHGRPWRVNSSFHNKDDSGPFDINRSIERWRSEISPSELALVELVCGALMVEFGYALSGTPPDLDLAIQGIENDPAVMSYLRLWKETGEGIEAFPTDPLDSKNWRDD